MYSNTILFHFELFQFILCFMDISLFKIIRRREENFFDTDFLFINSMFASGTCTLYEFEVQFIGTTMSNKRIATSHINYTLQIRHQTLIVVIQISSWKGTHKKNNYFQFHKFFSLWPYVISGRITFVYSDKKQTHIIHI